MTDPKPVEFCGSSLDDLRAFPESAKREAGNQIDLVQRGEIRMTGVGKMTMQRFANVWDAIEGSPEEAANMKLRSQLMIELKSYIARSGLSQGDAAKLFGVTQPRISDLMRGKINVFAIDALVNMAAAAGIQVEMQLRPAA